jgi:hypothetical protein
MLHCTITGRCSKEFKMAFLDLTPSRKLYSFEFDTQKALRAPIGAISPLWLAFASATSVGVVFWLASRWLQPKAPKPALPLLTAQTPAEVSADDVAAPALGVEAAAAEAVTDDMIAAATIAAESPTAEPVAPDGLEAEPLSAEAVVSTDVAPPPMATIAPAPSEAEAFVSPALSFALEPQPSSTTPKVKAAPRKPKAEPEAAPTPKTSAPRGGMQASAKKGGTTKARPKSLI